MTSDLIDELLEAASDKDAQTALTSLWAALDSAGFERSMNTNPSGADGGTTAGAPSRTRGPPSRSAVGRARASS